MPLKRKNERPKKMRKERKHIQHAVVRLRNAAMALKRNHSVSESEKGETDETPRIKRRMSSILLIVAAKNNFELDILRIEIRISAKGECTAEKEIIRLQQEERRLNFEEHRLKKEDAL